MREYPEVGDFIAYLSLKNLSPRTIVEYGKVLNSLFEQIGLGESSPKEITTGQLREYVASLQQRGLSAATVSNYVLVIKRFFSFLLAEGYIEEDPSQRLPRPKVGKRLPKALTITQVQDLFAAFRRETPTERRDQMFFRLVYVCGLRVSEAVNLRLEDIDLAEGTLRVIGKGDKERQVYLKPNLLRALKEYIAESNPGTYLFSGRGGDSTITRRNVEGRLKKYVKAAGLPDLVTPHTLRHSIAVHYLINGAPITFVQRLLGHASLVTTGVYTRLTDQMTKEIALQIPTALDAPETAEKPLEVKEARVEYGADIEY